LLTCFWLSACGNGGGDDGGREQPVVLEATTPENNVLSNDVVRVDISNVSQGYIGVAYSGTNEKVKLQITAQNKTYTYNILKRGDYDIFPLTLGSGTYVVNVYENISGTTYAQIFGRSVSVTLENEFLPFLYPNQYVDYAPGDKVVEVSRDVCADCANDLEVIDAVYDYCVEKIRYHYNKPADLDTTYLPDLDEVLSSKKGICFDYASLMTAMLRCQGIPTKLVVGYAGTQYHAWISVYTAETGWIENAISFNGSEWVRMDPTYASSSNASDKAVNDYIQNDVNYNALYFY
jgi:transglutaminase-like putative cysteine protease